MDDNLTENLSEHLSIPRLEETPLDKRVVLRVMSGPYAGLHQIVDTVDQAKSECGGKLPEFLAEVAMPPDDRVAPAGLVEFHTRYVLYKECSGPEMKRFNSRQV